MQKISNLLLDGSKGKPIPVDIRYAGNTDNKAIVIFCHGFKGFKDWGHYPLLADTFALQDFIFVSFNFSHNGTTPDHPAEFSDLSAFGENNFSIELDDLGLLIDFMEEHASAYSGDREKIYLIGHSRGGGISILKAYEDPRIKKLCTWASVKDANDFFKGLDLERWKQEGVLYTYNSRTQQDMPLHYQFYEDYRLHKNRLDIPKAASGIRIPWLIIHGTNDQAVSVQNARQLHTWHPSSELLLIDDADHTFGGTHPWTKDQLPGHAALAVRETIAFFLKEN